MVTHHLQDGQLDLEYDSSATQSYNSRVESQELLAMTRFLQNKISYLIPTSKSLLETFYLSRLFWVSQFLFLA